MRRGGHRFRFEQGLKALHTRPQALYRAIAIAYVFERIHMSGNESGEPSGGVTSTKKLQMSVLQHVHIPVLWLSKFASKLVQCLPSYVYRYLL